MTNKSSNLFKAVFFTLLAVGIVIYKLAVPSVEDKAWMWIAVVLSAFLAVAFFKRAFER